MKRYGLTLLAACGFAATATAQAASPIGEWMVEDQTAHIRIVSCPGDVLWGVISWTKDAPGKDENNPDPAKRNRSVMGMPILLAMKQTQPGRWDGEVYNAENGNTYTSYITLKSNDVLEIKGCVAGGLICGGEDWTRVPSTSKEPVQKVCSAVSK
jgi:uncharacterized protein (DUF2147 family)